MIIVEDTDIQLDALVAQYKLLGWSELNFVTKLALTGPSNE